MSDWTSVFPDFFNQIGNVIQGVWNDWTGNTANRDNIANQQQYNEQVFNRADTQYQRTVADLRAAGLSAQLAAGSPSSVAGQGLAPQRTVGNESQAMERLVGLINSIKQTNANIGLAGAQADKAAAEADEARARIPYISMDYDLRYMTAMANKDYTMALTYIAQQEGDWKSKQLEANWQNTLSDTAYKNKLADLAKTEMALNEARASESKENSKLIAEKVLNARQERANLVQDFKNKVIEGTRLTNQAELLLQQAIEVSIDAQVKEYNLEKSRRWNLRTTDSQNTLSAFGISANNLNSLGTGLNDRIYDLIGSNLPSRDAGGGYAW